MRREAKIILPTDCKRIGFAHNAKIHDNLATVICQRFGGVTITQGDGCWIDGKGECVNEPVTIYTFAAPDGCGSTREWMKSIADGLRRHSREDCIYVTYPSGYVDLI